MYYALLGNLYLEIDSKKAKNNYEKALFLAKTLVEKNTIQTLIKKID
jgi:RNA polymerase sigma-70 factor (ECF subfamily)